VVAVISHLHHVLGSHEPVEIDPVSKRPFERGHGAASHAAQAAAFANESAIIADLPKEGERCEKTGRAYEVCVPSAGNMLAQTKTMQTRRFLQDAAFWADQPAPGDRCLQTGREYDCSIGALCKSAQTRQFLEELSDEQKASRQRDFEAFRDLKTEGRVN
jgi:hypothetical protein